MGKEEFSPSAKRLKKEVSPMSSGSSSKRMLDSTVQQHSKRQKLTQEAHRHLQEKSCSRHIRSQWMRLWMVRRPLIDTVHCAKSSIATEDTTDNIEDGVSGVSQQELERGTGGIRNEKGFENLVCIEVFSGSGKLTAAIRKIGMRSVAVDRSSQRTSGPVAIYTIC